MELNENNVVGVVGGEAAVQQPGGGQDVAEILTEIRDMTKKELLFQKIASGALVCLVIAVVLIGVNVIPKVVVAVQNVNKVAGVALDSLDEINIMVSEVTETSENMNKVIEDNAVPLSEAVTRMSEVDYEGLNEAITDLQDAVGPLANFFNRFK